MTYLTRLIPSSVIQPSAAAYMSTIRSFVCVFQSHRLYKGLLIFGLWPIVFCFLVCHSHGGTIVFDDFEDGLVNDALPISWETLRGDPQPDASTGDLILSSGERNSGVGILGIAGDVSIQTQFQADSGVEVGLTAKFGLGPAGNDNDGYFIQVAPNGTLLSAARVNGVTDVNFGGDETHPAGSGRDFVVQMDVVGNVLSGWLWEAGMTPPSSPQVTQELDSTIESGAIGVYLNGGFATFRYIHIANAPIVSTCDPNTLGDINDDGIVNFSDFLVLSANFNMPATSHTDGDIDCDGTVAFADFLVLSANFNRTVGAQAASSVPEPSDLMLLGPAGLIWLILRRQR